MATSSFTAAAAGRPSASNPATRRWLPSASSSSASACTTSACEPVCARTWIGVRACSRKMAATIIRGPEEGNWAPGYYYVLFEDPDGIRLEVCFVPGAGLLAAGTSFDPSTGYI